MADSIRELCIKNKVTALEGITGSPGYDNAIVSVQRPKQDGNTFQLVPMLEVFEGEERLIKEDASHVHLELDVAVIISTRIDTTVASPLSQDETLNSLRADVYKAWMSDPLCGGYATQSDYSGSGPVEIRDGQPDTATGMLFTIQYRHRRKDPKSL